MQKKKIQYAGKYVTKYAEYEKKMQNMSFQGNMTCQQKYAKYAVQYE
jgi:hypothetical protein